MKRKWMKYPNNFENKFVYSSTERNIKHSQALCLNDADGVQFSDFF